MIHLSKQLLLLTLKTGNVVVNSPSIVLRFFKVGVAAAQLSIAKGLRVAGTAGSDDGMKLLNEIGVTEVFNHRNPSYNDEIMVRDLALFS